MSMLDTLRQHIIAKLGRQPEQLDEVLGHFHHLHVRRNDQVLRQGEVCASVYFVVSGCLQVFVYDSNYNETTRDIVLENQWCSELMSFGGQKPAAENIRAIEDTDLLAINFRDFETLMATVPPFGMVYKQLLEASYANSVYRINTLVSLTALERMKWLADNRPSLIQRVSSKIIASYLGITQETYSRLKRKL
jgi:CRP-like cAMP-binding protein